MSFENLTLIKKYIKLGNKKVEGWLSEGAISIINDIANAQKQLNIKGHICEIGVHHGKLFILLYLLKDEDENAVAIDLFDKQNLNLDHSGKGNLKVLLKNLKFFAKQTHRLKIIEEDSTQVTSNDIKKSLGGEVRLFSIDGGHTANITRNDLIIASKSICEGGVIILDDYFNEAWPGVSEGTNQFFTYDNDAGIVPFVIGGDKVLLTTKNYAEEYINLLNPFTTNPVLSKEKELFSHRVMYFNFSPLTLKQLVWQNIKDKPIGKLIRKSKKYV